MYTKVHVILESREESVVQKEDTLYVSVRAPAKNGAANKRVLELLRAHFGKGKRLSIVSGHHAPHKIVSIT